MIELILKYLDWQFDYTGMRWMVAVSFIGYVVISLTIIIGDR